MNKPPALNPKLMGLKDRELDEVDNLDPALREAVEKLVAKKLQAGRETAGNRSRTLSVKVDPEQYRRLLKARFDTERSGQEIFIEALELWFKKNKF